MSSSEAIWKNPKLRSSLTASWKLHAFAKHHSTPLIAKVRPLNNAVGGGKQAKLGMAKQGEVWLVGFYLGRHGCHEGLFGSTLKHLLPNGALVKFRVPIPRYVDNQWLLQNQPFVTTTANLFWKSFLDLTQVQQWHRVDKPALNLHCQSFWHQRR